MAAKTIQPGQRLTYQDETWDVLEVAGDKLWLKDVTGFWCNIAVRIDEIQPGDVFLSVCPETLCGEPGGNMSFGS